MLVDTDFMLLCLVSSLHVDSNVCLFQTVIFNLFLVAFVSCRFQGTLNSLIAAIYFAEQVNLYKYGLLSQIVVNFILKHLHQNRCVFIIVCCCYYHYYTCSLDFTFHSLDHERLMLVQWQSFDVDRKVENSARLTVMR